MRVCAAYSTGPVGGVSPRKRPLGLWVLAILIAIGSINNVSSGVTSLSLGQIGWAVYNLLFGVVGFLASIFMIAGRYYGFVLGYVIAGLLAGLVVSGLVFASLSELAGPEEIGVVIGTFLITAVISIVIYLVIIWYLRRPPFSSFQHRAKSSLLKVMVTPGHYRESLNVSLCPRAPVPLILWNVL